MIKKSFFLIFSIQVFIMFILSVLCVKADVIIYPSPDGIEQSAQYRIEVIQNNQVKEPFVYVTNAQLPYYNLSKTTSYSSFAFTGEIIVRVTKLIGTFNECKILPSSYGIDVRKNSNSVTFTLDEPRKMAVEFDSDITHPLLIFADPPEKDIPSPDDPDVIYFGPGVHEPDGPIVPETGQTVYLAPGAFVKALIKGHNTSNVTIKGRGILSGRKFGHTGGRHILFTGEGSSDILVEDIIIVDSPGFYVTTRGPRTHVRNVKGIGWWFNTDGVAAGEDGLIEDCFLKCNDDAIKLYHSGTEVYRTTIWQMENGAPFQISWNMPSDNSGFIVKDCDVIHCDHHWDNPNTAIFDAIHGGSGHMSNYLFEDIRIENCDWRLVSLQIRPNKFAGPGKPGEISDLTFRNISIRTPDNEPLKRINLIQGFDKESMISDIVFENLSINRKLIANAEEGNFEIEPATTENVTFEVTKAEISAGKSKQSQKQEEKKYFEWTNPITEGLNSYGQMHFHIFPENDKYYLVATEHPNLEWGKRGVILYASDNLKSWHEEEYLLNKKSIPDTAWYKNVWMAPEIHKIKGKYYLTFNCRNEKSNPDGRLGIGIAVADLLTGPYTVLTPDQPLVIGNNATLLKDDDGKVFAYWDLDGRFYAAELDPGKAEFLTDPEEILGPSTMGENYRFLDSPFVMKKDDLYYLLSTSFYGGYVIRVRCMVSENPAGPWRFIDKEPLYVFDEDEADMDLKMPWPDSDPFPPPTQPIFQHQIFKGPGERYYTVYHSSEKYSEPYMILEPVEFDNEGKIIIPEKKKKHYKVKIQ